MGELQVRCAGCAAVLTVPAGRMADGLNAAGWSLVAGVTRCPSCGPHESAARTAGAPIGGAPTAGTPIAAAAPAAASPYGRGAIARAERAGLNPDAAIRARINAGVLDYIAVGFIYGPLVAVLGLSLQSIDALALLVGLQFVYFFLQESRTGSTPGKRRYGLTVVTLDGERPADGALALRNVLRLIDSFPVFYASGLLSLMQTGRKRRQRIGDVVAGTTVVSTDPARQSLRTPRWLLPTLCSIALLLAAGAAFGAFGLGSGRKLDSSDEAGFVAGCSRVGGQPNMCTCLFETLRDSYGVDTVGRMQDYARQIRTAVADRGHAAFPRGYVAAVLTCRAQTGALAASGG
jgi:uncharacterized RDD family membrane protein YckC